jgi:hypothetical protein
VVRRGHLIAVVVVTFLIGCIVLLGVGCAGTNSETSKKEQEPTEATKKEQTRSLEATASEEQARCQGTRTTKDNPMGGVGFTARVITNDLPGCPKGGLLLGTDKRDFLNGVDGDDEVRGLGGKDGIMGGPGNDILYGGPGGDDLLGGKGNDVIYGGDGNDFIDSSGVGQRDKLYCGEGRDGYAADKLDYVDSSCEVKQRMVGSA